MYTSFNLAIKYLNYYCSAGNGRGHGIHSPFVFDFISTVLNDKKHYPAYDKVEHLRRKMRCDRTVLTIQDFGAGSSVDSSGRRSVAAIAKNAAKPKKYGQLLHRMVKKYQPRLILELGTSLGITTSYLASGTEETEVVTFEGAQDVARVARQNFEDLQQGNITLVDGNFDTTFAAWIEDAPGIDLCFIDGNHRREPTERYFQSLLKKTDANTIIVFDDIHWSREMEQAWETIRAHRQVRCSIDLFFIGIVFFRKEFKEKQDFVIRF